jgi:translation initiation factor aIF-2/yIF-2
MADVTEVPEECLHEDEDESTVKDDECLDPKKIANRKKKEKRKENKKGGACITDSSPPMQPSASGSESLTPLPSPELLRQSSPESPDLAPLSHSANAAPSPHVSPDISKAPKKSGKDKKESAVVKAARERLEQHRRLDQERLEQEEEQKRLMEEEQRRIKEEEIAAEAERQHKLDVKHAKIAAAKKEGTYQTKAQKAKAAKAAQAREQLLQAASPNLRPCASPNMKPCASPKSSSCSSPPLEPCEVHKLPGEISFSLEEDAADNAESLPSTHRSPIVCIMGHVDTGKTKLLDKLRCTNIQQREAGGITQQIGATFFPSSALSKQTRVVKPEFTISVPGLLMIDTPGHEAFNNLRSRGSSLCDIAVVVIDIMHGLELQTVESLEMLRKNQCPFVIALNKVDVLYKWASTQNMSVRDAVKSQEEFVQDQFQRRLTSIVVELQERGLNSSLYWENSDPDSISLVPTSAHTGEGIADLLFTILERAQGSLAEQLEVKDDVRCIVIEVKNTEGLGTTIDVLLVNGTLQEGDQIVLAGMTGPIVTTIRALLTPQPMKEMRVKGEFIHHSKVSTSMGVKISASGLEKAVCGSEVFVVKDASGVSELQEHVQSNFKSILSGFERQAAGVYVKASTIGSLEALLGFLQKMEIPVSDMSIGEVHKKDVTQAAIMKEKKCPEYAVILAFDVKINADAKKEAKHAGVNILTADIIYNLFDQFQSHMEKTGKSKKPMHAPIFPVLLQCVKPSTVHKTGASLVWCEVRGGQLRIDTPLGLLQSEGHVALGHVVEILKDRRPADMAYLGDRVCMKLQQRSPKESDEDIEEGYQLVSLITRESIESLKEICHGEMRHLDWACLDMLKKSLKVD